MEGDAGDEGGEERRGGEGIFFFVAESTDVERWKLFPNLNFHSSLTPHASESHNI